MNSEKDLKSKTKFNLIIIYIIGFVISIFFEFYWISYYPYDYFMLFGIGIIMCIFGYLSIDGILDIVRVSARKREEQNEIMIKASKAIYLTTKKIALSASSSSEHTPAASKDLNSLIDDLTKANDRLAKEVESAVSIHSLVQENRTLAEHVRKAVNDTDVSSFSPLDIEKEMKLDENINETDFETAAQAEAIDSVISQELSAAELSEPEIISESQADNDISAPYAEDTAENENTPISVVNSVQAEAAPPMDDIQAKTIPAADDVQAETVSTADDVQVETVPAGDDIPDEATPAVDNIQAETVPAADDIQNETLSAMDDVQAETVPVADHEQTDEATLNHDISPAGADKALTPDEIAALFANL